MPVFDFQCSSCDYLEEDYYLTTNEKPLTLCPKCGKETMQKLFPTNIQVRVSIGAQDLQQHIRNEQRKIRKELQTNENLRANISGTGEAGYHEGLSNISKTEGNLKNL